MTLNSTGGGSQTAEESSDRDRRLCTGSSQRPTCGPTTNRCYELAPPHLPSLTKDVQAHQKLAHPGGRSVCDIRPRHKETFDVRFGSKADIARCQADVR